MRSPVDYRRYALSPRSVNVDTPEKPKRKSAWPTVLTLLLLFGGCVAVDLEEHWRSDRALSPGPCRTIGCLARTKPAPQQLAEVRIDGRDYIVWFGESKPMWLVPSGPSCYVFDDRGRLVTWSSLTGEGGDIGRFSVPAFRSPTVKLGDVLNRVGRD